MRQDDVFPAPFKGNKTTDYHRMTFFLHKYLNIKYFHFKE